MTGMGSNRLLSTAVAVLAAAAVAGCSSDGSSADFESRGTTAVDECRGHGGVSAIEDDVVICGDQTSDEERGTRAAEACRGHGGVSAFDDDIVICRDQTFHEAQER
jgi:hypothetical protein